MGAFDNGFGMGMRAFQLALENKRQAEFDDRERTEFQQKQADRAREAAAWDAMSPPAQVGAGPQNAIASGPAQGIPGAPQSAAGPAVSIPSVSSVTAAVPAAPAVPAPAGGIAAAMRPPTEVERLNGLMQVAHARRDLAGYERLAGQRKTAEEDEVMANAIKGYTGAEDQIGTAIKYINNNSSLIRMREPGKDGVMGIEVRPPDAQAQFLKLGKADQAQVYAAVQMMERNPSRAYEILGGVNKALADAVKLENDMIFGVGKANNDVAFKRRESAQRDAHLGEVSRHNRATESIARDRVVGSAGSGGFDPLSDFDPKQARKAAMDQAIDEAKNNPGKDGQPMGASQIAARAQGIYAQLRDAAAAENTSRQIASTLKREFADTKGDPNAYASIYKKALQIASEEHLKALGYEPPGKGVSKEEVPAPAKAAPPVRQHTATGPAELPQEPDRRDGMALDAARAAAVAANAQLQRYGLRQRRDDPSGYEGAVANKKRADLARAEAEERWKRSVVNDGVGPYFGRGR